MKAYEIGLSLDVRPQLVNERRCLLPLNRWRSDVHLLLLISLSGSDYSLQNKEASRGPFTARQQTINAAAAPAH
jgi:hypothetical protein